jgi:cytochrome c peroxidase
MDVGCASCHSGVALGGNSFQKFGVYGEYRTFVKTTSTDSVRKDLTKKEEDKDQFKVLGLRNVAMTHPYLHDGCVSDLAEVVKIMGKSQLNRDLSEAQVKAIVAFLNSLTGEVPADAKVVPAVLAS